MSSLSEKNYKHIKGILEKEYNKQLQNRDRELFSSAPFKEERVKDYENKIRVCSSSLKELETLYYQEDSNMYEEAS